MVSGKGTKRLGKVAREFNVGISTMVEFLNKKGHQVDSNPNAKIEDVQYILLQKEYSSDINLKKESELLNLRTHRHQKNETLSIDDVSETDNDKNQEEEKEDDRVLRITDHSAKKSIPFPSKEKKPVENIKFEAHRNEVKILGKIDLDRKPFPKKPEPVKEEKPKVEAPIDTPKPEKPEIKEKTQPAETEKPKAKFEPKAQHIQEEKPFHKKPEYKNEVKPAEQVIKASEPKKVETNNHIETKIPKVENDVKVIGRIDLNTINQLTRPPKKTKKQREDERKARNIYKKPDQVKAGKDEKELKPEAGKRPDGTTPATAQSNDAKRRKRKRIKKEKIDPAKTTQTPATGTPQLGTAARPHPANRNIKRKRPVRQEVSEVDVQKQVKDTLARLTNKTKSKGAKYRRDKRAAVSEKLASDLARAEEETKIIQVTEFVSVNELANMMDVNVNKIISTCMSLGMFVSINQRLDAETLSLVAEEFGFKVEFISAEVMEAIEEVADTEDQLLTRPPIVTVMGHVDHGKTSLLDYIRSANVIAGEAGGITQHIGAYNVKLEDGRKITFLDTPGHEAFTAMRARGAQVTDIAIIIVAADDNVMPQTIEAINHASAAGVPIVFAINKIDKPGANPDAIKEKLANMNYLVEEWGGKYQSHDISAKNGIGISELLEKVILEAEMLELKANPNKNAIGSVVESSLDKGRGYVATVLVSNGTLREGDVIIAGQ